jgi:GNAT superfamily N-acetyltransferase
MSAPAVVRGALWAGELSRLPRPEASCDGYALVEVQGRLASKLARSMRVSCAVVRARMARGARAFAAWSTREDAVAGWLWMSTAREWAPPIRRELHFAADECYVWDAGTLPDHRDRGLFAALLRWSAWRMAQEGARLMWVGILDENLASQRANAAAGLRPIVHLSATHEPEPSTLHAWAVEYADERLVVRAMRVVGTADGGAA